MLSLQTVFSKTYTRSQVTCSSGQHIPTLQAVPLYNKNRVFAKVEQRNLKSYAAASGDTEDKGETPPSLYVELPRETLKGALLDSLHGTERGVKIKSEARAEINELIAQLEAKNPTPSTSEAKEMLHGNWKLVYTSSLRTLALLAASNIPLVTIGDVNQNIDTYTNTVENKLEISLPFSKTSFSTVASFEVRSPKRLQVMFERGIIQTPTLLDDISLPSSVSVFGQSIDLSSLNQILQPGYQSLKDVVGQLGNIISQGPDLEIPLDSERAQGWLLTTYLDESLRISRSEGDGVFILVKEAPKQTIEPEVVGEGESVVN
eukprot:TRINITY_DN3530_c0_g1_i3.p1 TRINITY_DN3530_c0_g1~~TRINITY_DN3530_c0_g1_i3.p1  ORF type:complete len:318 (+),score=43.36 TRINITY_DN3530_c0_g1_i3:184-1137(+)